jgi:hypothetical protein
MLLKLPIGFSNAFLMLNRGAFGLAQVQFIV